MISRTNETPIQWVFISGILPAYPHHQAPTYYHCRRSDHFRLWVIGRLTARLQKDWCQVIKAVIEKEGIRCNVRTSPKQLRRAGYYWSKYNNANSISAAPFHTCFMKASRMLKQSVSGGLASFRP